MTTVCVAQRVFIVTILDINTWHDLYCDCSQVCVARRVHVILLSIVWLGLYV